MIGKKKIFSQNKIRFVHPASEGNILGDFYSNTELQLLKLAASYASKGQKREFGADVVAELKKYPNDLWVVVRAIDANIPNDNGDYFSHEELLKEVVVGNNKKMPAYKTFEGCPVFCNHENDDIEKARGKVVHAKWVGDEDDEEKYVECLLRVDKDAYPHLAQGIEKDYIVEVSMGAQVEKSICSICGNVAENEDDYCVHIKNNKSKKFTGNVKMPNGETRFAQNEDVYEINQGIKFIEISWVADGACEACKKIGVVDVSSVLSEIDDVFDKTSQNIKELVSASSHKIDEDYFGSEKLLEEYEGVTKNIADIVVPLNMLLESCDKNEEIREVFAELNKEAAQEDIDRLRAALSVLEDVCRVILSRKENINLDRLEDLAGVMADLQSAIEKLIDEGFGAHSSADLQSPVITEPGIPQGVQQGPSETGVGTVTQPQYQSQSPQTQYNPAVAIHGEEGGQIPTGNLVAASNKGEFLEKYDNKLSEIKELTQYIKNGYLKENDLMLSQREKEKFNFRKQLNTLLADKLKDKSSEEAQTSVNISVECSKNDNLYKISIDENGFTGYYNNAEVAEWDFEEASESLLSELHSNPEKIAKTILSEFVNTYSNEGGESMSKVAKEKVADKANETINHDVVEEELLEESRDGGKRNVEHDAYESQMIDSRKSEYTESVQNKLPEQQLGDKGSRQEGYSESVGDDTQEAQLGKKKKRDETHTESVKDSTVERQLAENAERKDEEAPLLEKNLKDKRPNDTFDEYPGYTNQSDGPAGPGWGKDTDFPLPKHEIEADKNATSKAASVARDIVNGFGDIIVASETPPKTLIREAKKIIEESNVIEKIAEYDSIERREERDRQEFFNKEISLRDRIIDSFADVSRKYSLVESDVKDLAETILGDRKAADIISSNAKEKTKKEEKKASIERSEDSKKQVFKMAFRSAFADEINSVKISENIINDVRSVLAGLVDTNITPEELFNQAQATTSNTDEFCMILEDNITEDAINQRKQKSANREWKLSLGEEVDVDLEEEIINKLASYVIESKEDPIVVAQAVSKIVANDEEVDAIKQMALNRMGVSKNESTIDEEGPGEEACEENESYVKALVEEVGVEETSENFVEAAKKTLGKVLSEEFGIDLNSIEMGDIEVEGSVVKAKIAAKEGREIRAQYNQPMHGMAPAGAPAGMPMGMPTGMPAMPQQSPGAMVPPAEGVGTPQVPTEDVYGDEFGLGDPFGEEELDGLLSPEDNLPPDLVPLEIYVRLPQGSQGVPGMEAQMGAAPTGEAGMGMGAGMPTTPMAGTPMAAAYKLKGDNLIKTASMLSHRCPNQDCGSVVDVDFENSVGYCNVCDTPFIVKFAENEEDGGKSVMAVVEWTQPKSEEEFGLEELELSSDEWWK